MKKIILCVLLIAVLFIVASCDEDTIDISEVSSERYATILMLDGSIVKGPCTNVLRYSDNWIYVKVNGTKYWLDTWRVILKEK